MLARSSAVAIASSMLLAACASTTGEHGRILPPWLRDQGHQICPPMGCKVQVNPNKDQWVYENVDALPGTMFTFTVVGGWEFANPPIVLKASAPPGLSCTPNGNLETVCTVSAEARRIMGYTIRAKRLSDPQVLEYDPFIWPK